MKDLAIFPEPKQITWGEGSLQLVAPDGFVTVCETSPAPMNDAVQARLKAAVEKLGGKLRSGADICGAIELVLHRPRLNPDRDQEAEMDFAPRNRNQAYTLEVLADRVRLTAADGPGLLYGAVTLAHLMTKTNEGIEVPRLTIRDWPDMTYRGLFAESRWGMDLMTLQDWQDAVDYLVDLKYNVLTVGVYNCWPAQYDGDVSEWLMVPIKAYPELKKEQHIDYYSPAAGEWQHLKYLPKMFSGDFFGELVAYAKSRGMIVRPHFNTPGHNSLIPRLLPEISARDEQGNPTGYGFCLSNEKTYEVMFTIIDEIVDRYLLPHGVTAYHIAADEVYPLVGMDPRRPFTRISPWCKCEQCAQHSEGELYVRYIERIVTHLHEKGINLIGMWYDQLVRGGSLNEDLAAHFEQAGARDEVVLHWWNYGDFFDTTHPELGFRRWVTPMTGYYYQTTYRGHLDNIYLAEKLGSTESAEGTESYGVFDPAFHRHFCAQGEWSWNFIGGGTQQDFTKKYARALFGGKWSEGLEGLHHFQLIVDSYPAAGLGYSMFRYGYDYGQSEEQATARDNYPQVQVASLARSNPAMGTNLLHALAGRAERAMSFFRRDIWRDPALQQIYLLECRRYSVMARTFATCAAVVKGYEGVGSEVLSPAQIETATQMLSRSDEQLAAILGEMDSLLVDLEREREEYLQPHMMRELSLMRRFLVNLAAGLQVISEGLTSGRLRALPELEVMRVEPVPWVG